MRKILIISILLLLIANISFADDEAGKAGQTGAFLKFGLGARALGMGNAFSAVAEGIDAIHYNTAGAAFIKEKRVGFAYHSLSLDRNLNTASFLSLVRNQAVMGLSWINSSVSDVPMRNSDRTLYGNMANNDNLFTLIFAKKANNDFSFGANLKYIQSKLDNLTSGAVGLDASGLFKFAKFYAVGLSVQDIGLEHRWDSSNYWSGNKGAVYNDPFPLRIRSGLSGSFMNNTIITAVDIVKIEHLDMKYYAGAEYWILKQVNLFGADEESEDESISTSVDRRLLGLRAGYSDGSPTFGMSLYYPYGNLHGGFDYAYMAGKVDENSYHVFTMRVLF